jgi:hypothetical protein
MGARVTSRDSMPTSNRASWLVLVVVGSSSKVKHTEDVHVLSEAAVIWRKSNAVHLLVTGPTTLSRQAAIMPAQHNLALRTKRKEKTTLTAAVVVSRDRQALQTVTSPTQQQQSHAR